MNCNTALERLLDAEHDELSGIGNTPVALHVRSCAKCNAVANQLLAETRALALAVNYRPALNITLLSSRERVRPSIVFAASVGSIAAFVLVGFIVEYSLHARFEAGPIGVGSVAASISADSLNGQTPAHRAPVPAAMSARQADVASAAVQYVAAIPVLPVAYVPKAEDSGVASIDTARVDDDFSVSIDPPAGRRATVMRGRHPAVTVVWLY